ncbi:unnamed protein product [Dovyalis caffra]|uniref:Uncharacterized protein n=1 Tax=Dovyalis caffra TaxID=77055 RepID=A0AAV1RUJ7_9ROSI|nr:unnamed protein product [Dovyalis caffra]
MNQAKKWGTFDDVVGVSPNFFGTVNNNCELRTAGQKNGPPNIQIPSQIMTLEPQS